MKHEISPDKQTVESCLKQKSYYVDFYQREYVWSKETVEILLRDIFYEFELSYNIHKDEELTQEVLDLYNWYYMNVFITNKVDGKVYIVDGQQRLTTLTLIATKLYHIIDDENLKDTLKECIFSKDKFKGDIFCIDNEKRKDVMRCILAEIKYQEPYKNKTEENLVSRYNDISKFIDDKNLPSEEIKAFTFYFLERLVMVELSIEKDDTPMVFEVINDRGESLKPFEILKGKMIGALGKNDTEAYSEKWDNAISCLNGIQDAFFIDFIKSKFLFKGNAKLESALNQAYHRYIFDYNDIADSLQFRKTDKKHIANIKHFIDTDFKYYSKLYAKIRANQNQFLRYDNVINDLSGQYQIIMAACTIDDPNEDEKIDTIAKEIDRLWILLILNGTYDSNNFQNLCFALNQLLKEKNISEYRNIFDQLIIDTIRNKRNTTPASVLDYQNFIKKNYSNMNPRSLRYLFARIEKFICEHTKQSMQNDVEYISTKTGNKTGYHIEHILSHNQTNKKYFENEEEFEDKRNLLGGLLLLKGADNISSGNEEYSDKLKTYSSGLIWGHSLCADFYHANKDFAKFNCFLKEVTSVEFKPFNKFDKEALSERSLLLYNLIKVIWEV
ncbi:DUF262 domain-containing protein [Prevotella nigrescens]|uniref:DUF262 domain-containing protein n=1 Tax=Prevotella nigrescens TaxID=28133 RepID=UPI0028E29077|nr:DUF262 domain-containing protein [Prevotella nigrescens]